MRILSLIAVVVFTVPAVAADKLQVVELWPGKVPDESVSRLSGMTTLGVVQHALGLIRGLQRLHLVVGELDVQTRQRIVEMVRLRGSDDRRPSPLRADHGLKMQ